MVDNASNPPNLPTTISPRPKINIQSKSPAPAFISHHLESITRTCSRSPSLHPVNSSTHTVRATSLPPPIPLSFNRSVLRVDESNVNALVYSAAQVNICKNLKSRSTQILTSPTTVIILLMT